MSKFTPLEIYLTRGGNNVFAAAATLIEEGKFYELNEVNVPFLATKEESKKKAIQIVKDLIVSKKDIDSSHPDNDPDRDEMEEKAERDKELLKHWSVPYPGQLGLMEYQQDSSPLGERSEGYLLMAHLLIKSELVTVGEMAILAGNRSDLTARVITRCQRDLGVILGDRTLRDHIKRAAKSYIRKFP